MKRITVFLVLLSPLFYLLATVQSANDPIKYIFTYTGLSAIVILLISLAITPLKRVINLLKYRRMVGLFSFFYVFLHFLNFYVLDSQFDFNFVVKETLDKPFVYFGMISFVILLFMAITSTKKLFAKFNKYHKAVYLVLILVTIHSSMAQKVLSSLEYFFILSAIVLLGIRFYKKYITKTIKKEI